MMDYQEVKDLAESYKDVLGVERTSKMALAVISAEVDHKKTTLISAAYAAGQIDGKNAETRSAQEKIVLMDDNEYQRLLLDRAEQEANVSLVEVERRHAEAVISLTKAWLYSQSGVR